MISIYLHKGHDMPPIHRLPEGGVPKPQAVPSSQEQSPLFPKILRYFKCLPRPSSQLYKDWWYICFLFFLCQQINTLVPKSYFCVMGFKLNWFSLIIDKQKDGGNQHKEMTFRNQQKNNPVVGKYLRIFCRRQISTIPPFAEIHQPYFRRGNAVELNLRNAFCAFCTILHLFSDQSGWKQGYEKWWSWLC